MAEKVKLLEIDIDIDKATKEAQALKQTVLLLKEEMKKAKDVGGETSKEYIQLQAGLKVANKEYIQQTNLIGKSVQADTAKAGSLDQQKAKLSIVSQKWSALSKEERLNTDKGKALTKQKLDLTNALKGEEKATGDARREVGNYSGGIMDANQQLGAFVPGASKATGAAKMFGGALKIMMGPIGLLIAAIAAIVGGLKTFFASSEEGQNVLKKMQAIFQVVFGNISDILSGFGKAIVTVFTKPKEAIKGLKDSFNKFKEFIANTFGKVLKGYIEIWIGSLLSAFAGAGVAWQKFKGLFVDNADKINKAQENLKKQTDKVKGGFELIKEGAKNFGNTAKKAFDKARGGLSGYIAEQQKEINIAKKLADQQAALDKQMRESGVLEAKDRLKLAQLRNKIQDKANTSAEERINLIDEENKVLDEIVKRNVDIATQKYEIKKAQNALSLSTKEDLDEESKLLADIYMQEAALEKQRKLSITKRIEAENQLIAEKNKAVKETVKLLNEDIEAWRNSKEIKALADQEYNVAELEKQTELLNNKFKNELISEEEKNTALQELKLEYEDAESDRLAEKAILDFENDMALAEGNMFAELDLERQGLELKKQQELDFANKIGADTAKVEAKYAKAERALNVAELNAKLALTAGFTDNLATIFGEQTAIGKAAAVASATISSIQGAVNSFTSMSSIPIVGPILGAAAAAAALKTGYEQVKKILSVKSGLPGEGGVSASIPSASSSSISTPSIRTASINPEIGAGIVSRETEDFSTQSIANGMSQALEENPLQPTLVEDEITIKQEETLGRNETEII